MGIPARQKTKEKAENLVSLNSSVLSRVLSGRVGVGNMFLGTRGSPKDVSIEVHHFDVWSCGCFLLLGVLVFVRMLDRLFG